MSELLIYVASTQDVWFDGVPFQLDSLAGDLDPSGGALPRFSVAVEGHDDPDVAVVLSDESGFEDPPGTVRLQPFFEQWAQATGRSLNYEILPNAGRTSAFYEQFEALVDHWVREYDSVQLYLNGTDTSTDLAAFVSCFDGYRMHERVSVHLLDESVLNRLFAKLLDLHPQINRELTREHVRNRLEHWEFLEAHALARLHSELADQRPLLQAAAAYLQRDATGLLDLGVLDQDDVPKPWRHTRALLHCLDLVEYLWTINRQEEELAWYLALAVLELAPAAFGERYLSERFGEVCTLSDGMTMLERQIPGIAEVARKHVRNLGVTTFEGDWYEGHLLLSLVGARAVKIGEVQIRRPQAVDEFGLEPPDGPLAHVLWLATSAGIRPQRHKLAHYFHDLDRIRLEKEVLLAGGREARKTAVGLCDLDSATVVRAPIKPWLEAVARDEPVSRRNLALRSGPSQRAKKVRRLVTANKQPSQPEIDALTTTVKSWITARPTEGRPPAALVRAARKLVQAHRPDLHADIEEALATSLWASQRLTHAGVTIHDVLAFLPDSVFIPADLASCDSSPGSLRQLMAVFAPVAATRANPVLDVRRRLLDALTEVPRSATT